MVGGATFGEVLRVLRKRAGLTQGALAAAAGCSVSYISALETGQRRPDAGMVRAQVAPALAGAGAAYLVDRLLEANPGAVENIRKGKAQAIGFLVGQAMRESQGKADLKRVREIIAARVGGG